MFEIMRGVARWHRMDNADAHPWYDKCLRKQQGGGCQISRGVYVWHDSESTPIEIDSLLSPRSGLWRRATSGVYEFTA